jgi:hypothetical protein
VNDVASVLVDVEKVGLDVSILREVAVVFLNVSDVVFECCGCYFLMLWNLMLSPNIRDLCCRHVMLSVVEGRTTPDVGCCKHSFSILRMLSFDVADM